MNADDFRRRAAELLLIISRSQEPRDHSAYVGHWGRLWDLIVEAKAAGLLDRGHTRGPWAMVMPDNGGPDIQLWLAGGAQRLPIRMPSRPTNQHLDLATRLDQLLNGAGVQPP